MFETFKIVYNRWYDLLFIFTVDTERIRSNLFVWNIKLTLEYVNIYFLFYFENFERYAGKI